MMDTPITNDGSDDWIIAGIDALTGELRMMQPKIEELSRKLRAQIKRLK